MSKPFHINENWIIDADAIVEAIYIPAGTPFDDSNQASAVTTRSYLKLSLTDGKLKEFEDKLAESTWERFKVTTQPKFAEPTGAA
jgi:hypothetical protein